MAAYDVINGYEALRSIVYEGRTWWYRVRVPTGANVGTPLRVCFWIAQAAHTQENFGTPGLQATANTCINDQRGDRFGLTIDTGAHDGWLIVFFPEYDNTDASRISMRSVYRLVIADMIAYGFNIWMRGICAAGWSTGAIQWLYNVSADPTLWACGWLAENSIASAALTNFLVGPPLGILPAVPYFDPPIIAVGSHTAPGEYDGNASTDTLALLEVARLIDVWGVSMVQGMAGNDPATAAAYMTYWGRPINNLSTLLTNMQARGLTVGTSSAASSTAISVSASERAHQRIITDADHTGANNFMFSTTNMPLGFAYMAQRDRPVDWVAPTPVFARACSPFLL